MSDTTPPATPVKSFLLSKTLLVQVLMLALTFYPPALAWIKSNPVDVLAVFAAVNVLVRFFTSGKVSIFSPEDGEKNKDSAGGLSPCVLPMCMAAGLMGFSLPSCTGDYPVTGSLSYRDPRSGAKAGLSYSPGKKLRGGLTVPIYDAETGELLGVTDIALGKKPVVTAAK